MDATSLYRYHPRDYREYHYVYPTLSRRAGGISLGINLNHDLFCNFQCVYCQVDRSTPRTLERLDTQRLAEELDSALEETLSGRLFEGGRFENTPLPLRRLNDLAFSGEGEPTASPDFLSAVEIAAEARARRNLESLKIVLITNSTLLHRPVVRNALELLDKNNGEIWAKLDAGTIDSYQKIDRSSVPFERILENILSTAQQRPIVLQSLFMRLHQMPPTAAEIDAYCERLNEMTAAGARFKLIQAHTVARTPAEIWVESLSRRELESIAETIRRQTGLPVAVFV